MMKMLSCCPLQARRGGGRSLPAGLASCRHHGGAGRSQRLGLRLAPSAAQHPGPADAHARRVAAAGPQPPGGDRPPAEPTQRGEKSAPPPQQSYSTSTENHTSCDSVFTLQLLLLNLKIYGSFFFLFFDSLKFCARMLIEKYYRFIFTSTLMRNLKGLGRQSSFCFHDLYQ